MGQKQDRKYQNPEMSTFFLKSNIDSNRRKTYSLASKTSSEFRTRQKISELRDEHIFFALEYSLESLQRIQR